MALIFRESARMRAFLSVLFLSFLMVGCSTFQGPGTLQYGPSDGAPVKQAERLQVQSSSDEMTFDWPVDEAKLTRGFIATPQPPPKTKSSRKKRKRPHLGLDLANRRGTPVLASQTGRVVYAGSGFRGYGRLIVIEHSNEWATFYSHLDKILVKEGQAVSQGDKIGLMGRTGRATGVHLHFEIRHHRRPVDPLAYLPTIPHSSRVREYAATNRENSNHKMSQGRLEEPQQID